MIKEAQGRLKVGDSVAIIDIGSNSVRLVAYEGLTRAPSAIFNEKALCGLGRGVKTSGRLADEAMDTARLGYQALFQTLDVDIDAHDPAALVLFPEMDARVDVPEITTACWGILHKDPDDVMCASSRMVVKRKGAHSPAIVACTLLPYDPQFELGADLADALRPVALNHPHCAKFCVLGGASCSAG